MDIQLDGDEDEEVEETLPKQDQAYLKRAD
jgi:hypothetical protein